MKGVILLCLALGGCAAQSQTPPEIQIQGISTASVCETFFYAPAYYANIAKTEAARRGIDCNDFRQEAAIKYQERLARQRAQGAAINDLSRQQLLSPPPPPGVLNCRTVRLGNSLQTQCF